MTKLISQDEVRAYLRNHGVSSTQEVDIVLDGFDFNKPVYLQPLDSGSTLFQFVHTSSADNPLPGVGNWFCISGAAMPDKCNSRLRSRLNWEAY
jgi:hypothetical protein